MTSYTLADFVRELKDNGDDEVGVPMQVIDRIVAREDIHWDNCAHCHGINGDHETWCTTLWCPFCQSLPCNCDHAYEMAVGK